MKKSILLILLLNICLFANATKPKIESIEPLNWWVGMQNPELQLSIYGENIAQLSPEIEYNGVSIIKKVTSENPNYIFLYVNIDKDTKAGKFNINFKDGKRTVIKRSFELKQREEGSALRESFGPQDAVYLLMPDRFVNGNVKNDKVDGYYQGVDRSDLGKRHGGDIEGVIQKLPYIADLGCTALWITPFFNNNDTQYSYHHYATDNYYKVDPRMGSNEDYKRLGDECKKLGIKLIIDVVPNHCSINHQWVKDEPASNWFNKWPTYTSSNYRMEANTDPHASEFDKKQLEKGWFSGNMPDFNLSNKELFTYLSQAYIWWIEYAGATGIRVDTYPYNDIHIAAQWVKRFSDEYPNMNIVGECWLKSSQQIAYYQHGNNNKDGFQSYLPSVMDFVLKDVIHASFNENEGWDTGLSRFYAHYAKDFAYHDVNQVMNFLDNHDIERYSVSVGHDVDKYKMGMATLITTRGYPQIYAGNEIMLDGIHGSYEGHRFDFPGGWKEDTRDAFTEKGRTDAENDVFNFTRTLLNFRKQSKALQTGKMIQFIPYEGIYIFARCTNNETVLVIKNNNKNQRTVNIERYKETFNNFTAAQDVVTGKEYKLTDTILVEPKTVTILNLK